MYFSGHADNYKIICYFNFCRITNYGIKLNLRQSAHFNYSILTTRGYGEALYMVFIDFGRFLVSNFPATGAEELNLKLYHVYLVGSLLLYI